MDDAEQFLPLYLRFVKGVVDSSDLPLNISRELLQQNADLVAMRGALTRRVLDLLARLSTSDAEDYQKFWGEFGQVLKEGLVEDQANKDKLAKLIRFATTKSAGEKQDQSLDDYLARASKEQDKIYYILAESHATAASSPHLEQLRDKDIEVLLLTDRIDPWLVESLTEYEGKAFADVARARLSLPDGDGEITQDALNEQHRLLLKKIKKVLRDRIDAVNVSRRLVESPACVVSGDDELSPGMRRMLEASGQSLPDMKPILEVNIEHPLVARLSAEADGDRFAALSNIVLDHALLAEGAQLNNPAEYVTRMNEFLVELDSGTRAS
jgi:molecular chaperone HtpG